MSAVKEMIRSQQQARETAELDPGDLARVYPLYVSPAHMDWLIKPEHERKMSPAAVEHANAVFVGGYKHPRELRISPSALGDKCTRRVLFSYGGHPKAAEPPRNVDLMDLGSLLHLKWQMEGLSAGWLARPEVWGVVPELKMGGSADGELADGSLFELKTVSDWAYGNYKKSPADMHLLQMEAYWLIREHTGQTDGDWQLGSLVYVNRDRGDYKEWRIHSSRDRRLELLRWLEEYDSYIDADELPDMLTRCVEEMTAGKIDGMYGRCPYRATCPAAEKVTR